MVKKDCPERTPPHFSSLNHHWWLYYELIAYLEILKLFLFERVEARACSLTRKQSRKTIYSAADRHLDYFVLG